MAKDSIRDFSATAGSNTDIQSVNIDENCPASGINNAIRELMVDLKNVSTGAVNLETPAADSLTVAGDLTVDTDTLKVDSSNNRVGIGITSPAAKLSLPAQASGDSGVARIAIESAVDDNDFTIAQYEDVTGTYTQIGQNVSLNSGGSTTVLDSNHKTASIFFDGRGNGSLMFHTGGTNANAERMRIDSNGDVIIGKTSASFSTPGFFFNESPGQLDITCNQNNPLRLNRVNNDGILTSYQQDGSEEGTVSVSGGTVSYNGGHLSRWSRLLGGSKPPNILKGTVMSNLDDMIVWSHDSTDAVLDDDGNEIEPARDAYTEDNEQLNHTKVSDSEGDIDVAGVFVAWDDRDNFNDFFLAMTGDMVIRIAKDTTVARGDLLMSAGDGTAKPQDDDIVRSKTIAKVTSITVSHTYDDGSYLVPCVLMAC